MLSELYRRVINERLRELPRGRRRADHEHVKAARRNYPAKLGSRVRAEPHLQMRWRYGNVEKHFSEHLKKRSPQINLQLSESTYNYDNNYYKSVQWRNWILFKNSTNSWSNLIVKIIIDSRKITFFNEKIKIYFVKYFSVQVSGISWTEWSCRMFWGTISPLRFSPRAGNRGQPQRPSAERASHTRGPGGALEL